MDNNRRNFIKTTLAATAGVIVVTNLTAAKAEQSSPYKSVFGLKSKPLDVVRIGMIGLGGRNRGHLSHYLNIEGVEIKAVCDIDSTATDKAQDMCVKAGKQKPDAYTRGDYDYRRMLEREDIDAVVIGTPWRWHTPMCVDAMLSGKHAFTEVPAAVTLEECWQLVDTAEKTQKNCMMMENVCYGREELMVLNMCRIGVFGDLLHGECAYIHDLRGQMKMMDKGIGTWRTTHHEKRNGNLYPTHGLGPVSQYMNINRGDRFDYLTSMSSPALGRAEYAKETFPPDHLRNQRRYICGDMNTSLIKTALGRSIMVQHDTTTPRPYDRINLIQGTKGIFRGFPNRVAIQKNGNTHEWQDIEKCFEEYDHPFWVKMGEMAEKSGGHGGMDFLMNWRMIYCLRNGEALDQDVYDAAAWSSIGPLSEKSVANRSDSVDIPDFTRGRWMVNEPLPIIE
jgi:hypothetical protein